jgi:sulfatase maturation enzyme AslB (radical SAM superfamily)
MIIEYNTNMTILPTRVQKLWQQFKQVRVGASIDGFGEVFEFQRYPAQWNKVYENLRLLDQLGSPVISWLACTVTVYNVMHLPDFMLWKVTQSGFQNINSSRQKPIISHHMAHKPEHLNVRSLTTNQKQQVLRKFEESSTRFDQEMGPVLAKKARQVLDSVSSYMMAQSSSAEQTEQMFHFSQRMDQIRGQHSARFLPIDAPPNRRQKTL